MPVPRGGCSNYRDRMLLIRLEEVWIHSAMIVSLKVVYDDLNSRPNCAVSIGLLFPAGGQ